MMSLFGELKRRNVFRVGIAYLIASWLVLQVVDVVGPILELPAWISRAALLFIAIGFVVSLVIAWAYELTPDGVKRESEADRSESNTNVAGRKLNVVIIGVLLIALAFFALDKFIWNRTETPVLQAGTQQRTIAVLPFVNMSASDEQEYFSDGLTEELLNLLARIPQLRVTSRSSAFYYKGKDVRIADVGRELGVGHVLEGSVRRSGDTIRITAQLIDVTSDSHVWSDTWDRTFDDIFLIQDEIAKAVVDELQIRLGSGVPLAVETEPEAYTLFLRARHLVLDRTVESYSRALELLNAVLEIDPDYIPAWLELGDIYWDGRGIGMFVSVDPAALARDAASRVFDIDPDNARAHLLLGMVSSSLEVDIRTAQREIDRALALDPNDIQIVWSAAMMAGRTGNVAKAQELAARARQLDPVGVDYLYGSGLISMAAGQFDEAEVAFRRAIRLAPDGVGFHQRLAWVLLIKGQYEEALKEAEKEVVEARQASVRGLIYQTIGDTEQARLEHEKLIGLGERWTYEIARLYAYRNMPDEAFDWMERAFARSDSSFWFVSWDPFLDGIRDDPRFASVEERLWINRE
ncbi:MAG: tetratricopeptide repeat protein [Gammaproteobacteria bacterium]|nr:tetratricopeptide repeat protein [Gammaproteobacteria bacterium]